MAKPPEFMHVRPVEVDVGRGPELARLTIRRNGKTWRLPADGGKVPSRRREGAFWKARITEGSAERFDLKTGATLTIDGKTLGGKPPKPPKAKPAAKPED